MKLISFVIFVFISTVTLAQFPGPVGTVGTTAMYKDSSAFVAWGKMCNVRRGYQDISNTSLGNPTVGDSSFVLSKADGGVVSLGDGGYAIVTFTNPITNGPGFDFAVFENAFNDSFLELGFVEVSSNGVNYFRFPSTSDLPTSPQFTNDAAMDATKINNFAGKYRTQYGTPFDLQELTGIPQLNINAVTHVKIIDVVGSINSQYATYDKNNTIINDPWPTPFISSGFDLDAIGVINESSVGVEEFEKNNFVKIYPNPSREKFVVHSWEFVEGRVINMFNVIGEEVLRAVLENNDQSFDISHLNSGIYFVRIETKKGTLTTKLIKE